MPDINPADKRPLYSTLSPGWEANRDFAEMHPHILRDGDYLEEFGGKAVEVASQYALRKKFSMALDICRDLIDLRVSNIFRVAPVRTYEDSPYASDIEAFLADVDGDGTMMDEFMRQSLWDYYVNGCDIVVDKEMPGVPPRTRADENGLRVFLHRFTPLERLDWAATHSGRYSFARYDLGETPRDDEAGERAHEHQYLTMTRDLWRLYTVVTDADGKTDTQLAEGFHVLKRCPVVQFYFRRSSRADYDAVPLSLMTRMAPIAEFMLNLLSQGQLDLYLTVAFFVAIGVNQDDISGEMGAATCWTLTNENAKIQNIVTTVEHVVEKREWLNLGTTALLRIGKLMGLMGELKGRAGSGVQVAIESGPLYSELSSTARQIETVEREVVQLAMSRLKPQTGGGLIPLDQLGYSAHYNDRYTLENAADLIQQAHNFSNIGVNDEVPSLVRLLLRKVADAVSREGDVDYDTAMDEIRDADFSGIAAVGEGDETKFNTLTGEAKGE